MIRTLVILLLTIFVLSIARKLIGVVMGGVSEMMSPPSPGQNREAPQQASGAAGGALKRDPVCGTYVPASNSVTKKIGKDTLYFCSSECRDKYAA